MHGLERGVEEDEDPQEQRRPDGRQDRRAGEDDKRAEQAEDEATMNEAFNAEVDEMLYDEEQMGPWWPNTGDEYDRTPMGGGDR